MSPEASPEHPLYSAVSQAGTGATQYMVVCDEGWRESIVCSDMYEWAARWLVEKLQGQPYAPEHRPASDAMTEVGRKRLEEE